MQGIRGPRQYTVHRFAEKESFCLLIIFCSSLKICLLRSLHVYMYVCVSVSVYVCMCVCAHLFICICNYVAVYAQVQRQGDEVRLNWLSSDFQESFFFHISSSGITGTCHPQVLGIQMQILILVQQMLYQLSRLSCPSDYLKVFLSYISTLDINSLSYIQVIFPILLISSVHCLLSYAKAF